MLTPSPAQALVLAVAALAAATVAAVAGFGGAAVLLPALVAVFGVRDAIPILTVAQLVGNASRVWFNRRETVLPVVGWFALGAVPLAFLGGLAFAAAPIPLLTRILGAFLLVLVGWRHLRAAPPRIRSVQSFAFWGAGFSFLSALLGSVGPLMAPFCLAYGLTRGAFIGTEALATVVMHLTKLVAYRQAAVLTAAGVLAGLALGPLMVLGSWLGKWIVERLPERWFVLLVEATVALAGLDFLLRG